MSLLTPPTHPLMQLWIRCRIHTVILGISSSQNCCKISLMMQKHTTGNYADWWWVLHSFCKNILQQDSNFMHCSTHTGHQTSTCLYNILSFMSVTTKCVWSKFIIWESRFYSFALFFTAFKRNSRCIFGAEICCSGALKGALGTHKWLGKEL